MISTFFLMLVPQSAAPAPLVPETWLVLESIDHRGRRPFRPDAVFARHLLDPGAQPPEVGQTLIGERQVEASWGERPLDEAGRVPGPIGYAYTSVEVAEAGVWIAELSGAGTLFVNGAGFTGDVYRYGFGGVPVALRAGSNDLFVTGVRGAFRLVLHPAPAVMLGTWDVTRPDRTAARPELDPLTPPMAAVLLANASEEAAVLTLRAEARSTGTPLASSSWSASLAPLALVKAPVALSHLQDETASWQLIATSERSEETVSEPLVLETRPAEAAARYVFTSAIDGSLQEFALLAPSGAADLPRGLVLTLHGAGVYERNQAQSYAAKPRDWIVAPTNRRPFGFDWQDWGRRDAYEVLDLCQRALEPVALFLTGHSMGGHGVWHLAANDPDRFQAIAPSAGWRSFDTYGKRPEGALRALWHAADRASDTEALIDNLIQTPTFILHGAADDNVPITEAQAMESLLTEHGAPPRVHFQEGAGHWWDGEAAGGADCVDWPGIFELFEEHREARSPDTVRFTTVDPGVDAEHYFVRIVQPEVYGRPSRVEAERLEGGIRVRSENVRRLELAFGNQRAAELDGMTMRIEGPGWRAFVKRKGKWRPASELPAGEKSPAASGPFKRAFDRGFVLVYGTAGEAHEDRALFERARCDQARWWYRANAAPPLISDQELLSSDAYAGRNLILYGNADTNGAWSELPDGFPLQAERGRITLGQHVFEGSSLGALFVAARRKTPHALVGVFADSGPLGSRLGYVLAPFVSGVGYPDYAIFSDEVLRTGDGGVLAAGWFDATWELQEEDAVRKRVKKGAR